jgi:hypothetical protein
MAILIFLAIEIGKGLINSLAGLVLHAALRVTSNRLSRHKGGCCNCCCCAFHPQHYYFSPSQEQLVPNSFNYIPPRPPHSPLDCPYIL